MTGRLWALIQAWIDEQPLGGTQAQVAKRLGVSKSTISLWKRGETLPHPDQLRRVAEVTGRSYLEVLEAALTDAGYLQREELMGNAKHPAPIEEDQDEPTRPRRGAARARTAGATARPTRTGEMGVRGGNGSVKRSGARQ